MSCLKLKYHQSTELKLVWNKKALTSKKSDLKARSYFLFGLKHKGYNNVVNGIENNYFTYQGQELTEDLGLNMHEWKYRFSDPSIGRFISIDPLAEDYTYNSTYAFQENKLGMGTELEGAELLPHPWMVADAAKNPNGVSAHAFGVSNGLANTVTGIWDAVTNPVQTLKGIGNMLVAGAAQGNPAMMLQADAALGSDSFGTSMAMSQALDGAVNDVVSGNGFERGTVIGEVIGAVAGTKGANAALKGASTAFKGIGITNPVPSSLSRVVPGNIKSSTLGAPSASDVFVTASKDISGLNASQIAKKLTIPQSSSGFNVIQFPTPKTGLSSPINRTNPGFVGRGRTAGGAREFTVPNQTIPANATVKKIN
ncbi:MAG: hypothetical protein GKR88_19140 [Flavobacteriaceae bacterium]|nr:MAG: hypothetical protein GKR88_19140 [Flavobacteriaceae bacterium]